MKAISRMICLIVLILTSLVPAYGQSSQDSSQEEPVVVSTNLVTVNVIVTDSKGRYVKGLKSEEFSIYDENVRQKIAHFSAGAAPVSHRLPVSPSAKGTVARRMTGSAREGNRTRDGRRQARGADLP